MSKPWKSYEACFFFPPSDEQSWSFITDFYLTYQLIALLTCQVDFCCFFFHLSGLWQCRQICTDSRPMNPEDNNWMHYAKNVALGGKKKEIFKKQEFKVKDKCISTRWTVVIIILRPPGIFTCVLYNPSITILPSVVNLALTEPPVAVTSHVLKILFNL